jgi:hypothetical protein
MEMKEYYQSSKWAEKRNARLKIDGFKCAKCGFTRALEVHHINYERFGDEDVHRDLITLCKKCHHKIEDQKRKTNPIINKAEHHTVYLAGKIRQNGWREGICGYRCGGHTDSHELYGDLVINRNLTVTGPFFISCDHGCYHGNGSHGVGAWEGDPDDPTFYKHGVPSEWPGCSELGLERSNVVTLCKKQIDEAEIVFVYIDCRDCFGTLAEIGYAHAKGKTIIIKFKNDDLERDMWFISKMQQKKTDVSDWWIREQLISKIKED